MDKFASNFVWYELATEDVESAKAFYGDVLGWGTASASTPNSVYTMFTSGGAPVAGLVKMPADAIGTGSVPQWTGYVSVGDVDVAAGRAKQLGGTVHIPPTDVPGVSRFSVIGDPQLATLVLVKGQERGKDRPRPAGAPGQVTWRELLTSDFDSTFVFYNKLFGWRKAETPVETEGAYQNFSAGEEAIGALSLKPVTWPRSLWLYYFSVAGIEAAVKCVLSRGGQVLFGPIALPNGVRIVHCTDVQGVPFALIDTTVSVAIGCYAPRNSTEKPKGQKSK